MTNPWPALFNQYQHLMSDETQRIIERQYAVSIAGTAPAIAHPAIKEISIVECGDPLVDINTAGCPRIAVMSEAELPLAHQYIEDIDPRSDRHGFVRQQVYHALERMIQALDSLAPHFGYQPGTLEIRVFEGLRDLATQKKLFESKLAHLMQEHADWSYEKAYQETSTWVSPYEHNVPAHATGAALDIHLWDTATQTFCDMGRFNTGGPLAPLFTQDPRLTEQQARNRFLCIMAATQAGLINYTYEFWHYSYGDRYATYWKECGSSARIAQYGAL